MALSDHLPCDRCGYDLRASTKDCPECGHPVELSRQARDQDRTPLRKLRRITMVSILVYIAVNIASVLLSMYGFIGWPWAISTVIVYALPVLAFAWAVILMIGVEFPFRPREIALWLVGAVIFSLVAGIVNFEFIRFISGLFG